MSAALEPLRTDPKVLSVIAPEDALSRLAPGMVNGDDKSAVAFVAMKGDFKEALSNYPAVRERLGSQELTINCTGKIPFMEDFDRTVKTAQDLAEVAAFPLLATIGRIDPRPTEDLRAPSAARVPSAANPASSRR